MTLPRYDFFYDRQIERYLEQLVRAFSGFQYQTGRRNGNAPETYVCPVKMESKSRMVAAIRRNLSENVINSVPIMSIGLPGNAIQYNPALTQNTTHVDTQYVVERGIDPQTGQYTQVRGDTFVVERLMPRIFEMSFQLDLWTSNIRQKLMLLEQILPIVVPGFQIQNSENPLDWGAHSLVRFKDISYSSLSIPVGTEDEIDITTLNFSLPIYISPPAKVRRGSRVEEIVNVVGDGSLDDPEGATPLTIVLTTPNDSSIEIENGVATLLGPKGSAIPEPWDDLFELYKKALRPGLSKLMLRPVLDDASFDIVGTLQRISGEPTKLAWQIDIDTLPGNTLAPINGIVDPLRTYPGVAGFPTPVPGVRYLILHDIGPSQAWGTITAKAQDIISWDGTVWTRVFQAATENSIQYVINIAPSSGKQLKFVNGFWSESIDGTYAPGAWRLSL